MVRIVMAAYDELKTVSQKWMFLLNNKLNKKHSAGKAGMKFFFREVKHVWTLIIYQYSI